ncbi:hypothetical protein [Pseudomonas kilonensis]|uniref:Uncharacterized protein n=1 Tax=Pseudomonas kilonensis TaxID=132476 RepID=A0ABY0ZJC3_9PSED|nr:hypothetical protein [Pseudomonas kilonensis]SEE81737.1 hypothetical protein SAMN04490188_5905 [Pseudomonas kilonensis]
MIEDFTTTIKAQLYERVSSPLLSSFIISWCGWNYKFLLILISNLQTHEKIIYIDLNIFPNTQSIVIHGIALPLITSLLLIFVYPIPAESIYRHVKTTQRRLKEIQQSIDDESPISKEQARKIRRESLENQLKYESEIDSKTLENTRLKEIISELQPKNNNPTTTKTLTDNPSNDFDDNPTNIDSKISVAEIIADVASNNTNPEQRVKKETRIKIETPNKQSNDTLNTLQNIDTTPLDNFIKESILEYIAEFFPLLNSAFNVTAKNGKLNIDISNNTDTTATYITASYTFETAIEVLESCKSALAADRARDKQVKKIGDNPRKN